MSNCDAAYDGPRTLYTIPAENLPKFEAELKKLSNRSKKLIGQEIDYIIYECRDERLSDGHFHRVYGIYLNVDVPKLDGWKFVAKIDHSLDIGNVVRKVPNVDVVIPDVYRTRTYCDHCNSARFRRNTYICFNEETNEFKQVGSTCVADFLGHDVYKIARRAELLSYADEIARGSSNFTGGDMRWIHTETYLAHAVMAIRKYGWVSAKEAREANGDDVVSTRFRAYVTMYPNIENEETEKPSEDDFRIAREAIEWVLAFEANDRHLSDYEANALIIARSSMIEYQHLGIAASIPAMYLKHNERLKAKEATGVKSIDQSEHVGEVGVRQDFGRCRVLSVRTFDSSFGTTWFYTFATENNDVLVWFASKSARLFKGEIVNLTGTVKKHDIFNDRKQTVITRCKAEVIREVMEAA
jgi:hypothetical protein